MHTTQVNPVDLMTVTQTDKDTIFVYPLHNGFEGGHVVLSGEALIWLLKITGCSDQWMKITEYPECHFVGLKETADRYPQEYLDMLLKLADRILKNNNLYTLIPYDYGIEVYHVGYTRFEGSYTSQHRYNKLTQELSNVGKVVELKYGCGVHNAWGHLVGD